MKVVLYDSGDKSYTPYRMNLSYDEAVETADIYNQSSEFLKAVVKDDDFVTES